MSCFPLPLINKLIYRATSLGDSKTKSLKASKAKRDAKIKSLTKSLSRALKDSSRVNRVRAAKLITFMEAEEERLGLMKKGKSTAKDLEDLKKFPLPIESEKLVHTMQVDDEVDGMKLVKWELYQVVYRRGHGEEALLPIELEAVEKGEVEDVNGFRSKIYIDFGTTDLNPIVVVDMLFQPLDGKSMPHLFNKYKAPPVYSDDQMPPRYSVDEKGELTDDGTTVMDEKNGVGPFPGAEGWVNKDEGKLAPGVMLIRGVLARSIRFSKREEKIPVVKVDPWIQREFA